MKYAIFENERREAVSGLVGECPSCGRPMIAKCGDNRVHHWAHKGARMCDPWWENETEWHRQWKGHFPKSCQEFIHHTETGEKHIADVRTEIGKVLEFQYSLLRQDERQARESFYRNMVWVVCGSRRKFDKKRFFECFDAHRILQGQFALVNWKGDGLLRDWGKSRVPVYFDFGDSEPDDPVRFETPILWRLNPAGSNGSAYLVPVSKARFVDAHLTGKPIEEIYSREIQRVMDYASSRQAAQPLLQFERFLARRARARRRF